MKFLKVKFPVNVRNTEASYETQYGINKGPTHYNASWDMAKLEVCSQKFVDLSEYGYAVSILNNGKDGFATVGNAMRLSLLRSSKAPDDTAEMGRHTIRWAIMPHSGQLGARTVRAAFDFNNLLKLIRAMSEKRSILNDYPISLQGDDSLVLDTIKRSEEDEDISLVEPAARKGRSVILRIYDSLGGRTRGIIAVNWRISKVYRKNILEDNIEEVSFQKGKFSVELWTFEVSTYRISLEG